MSPTHPPLTERIDRGAAGGHEFERLMHQILLRYGDREGFEYQPRSGASGDGGIDGLVPQGGVPGLSGPVSFQFKWLYADIHKSDKAQQVKNSFQRARNRGELVNWVLVTPWDLTNNERKWLAELPITLKYEAAAPGLAPQVHHWGREKVESLLRLCPSLFARYYPHEARALLEGYTGFDFREFAREYRQKVALDHGMLLTIGFPPEALSHREATTEIRLRDIFIQPSLLSEGGGRRLTIAELLRSGTSTVVLGDPGAGKSTLLAFLALLYSGEAKLRGFEPPREVSPFLVRLTEFVRLLQDRPGFSFLDFLESRARSDYGLAHAHLAFFESALRMGEAIVLLDGLDEVGSEATRHRVANAISAFHDAFPNCPFWTTSRIYGYTPNVRLSPTKFSTFRLGRLENDQVDDFIERWYLLQWPNNERERMERTVSLHRAVQRSPSVRRLAGSPLLLTLMAFIHQGLRRLPQDRGELYEKCIEMLLKTWQEAKQPEGEGVKHERPIDKLGLHIHTQKDYLAHLAFLAQERNQEAGEDARGVIPRAEALECLAQRHLHRSLRTRPDLALGEAREEMERFLDYIADRTGLLIDRGNGRIAFIHLSFQEYLAAWVFTTRAGTVDSSLFEKYIGVQAWEEVLLLRLYIVLRSPGGGGEQAFDTIVSALLRRLERSDAPQEWLTLAHALRDNLDFSNHDQDVILHRVLSAWLLAPAFTSTWFTALEEIALFAERPREALKRLLNASLLQDSPTSAVASLHLMNRLFGKIPSDAANRLSTRSDICQMLPHLVVFPMEPGFSKLLGPVDFTDWVNALSVVDSPASYRLSLIAASSNFNLSPTDAAPSAMLSLLFRKIGREICSRSEFATLLQRRSYEAFRLVSAPFWLRFMGQHYDCRVPLGSLLARPYAAIQFSRIIEPTAPSSSLLFPDLARETLATIDSSLVEAVWHSPAWLNCTLEIDALSLAKPVMAGVQALIERWVKAFTRSFEGAFLPICQNVRDAFSKDFIQLGIRVLTHTDREFVSALLGVKQSGGEGFGFADLSESAEILEEAARAFELKMKDGFQERLLELPQLPMLLSDLWKGALANHALAFGRESVLNNKNDEAIDPNHWLLENPPEVHLTALAWEEHARIYAATHDGLVGVEGAILVAHAAYAALMTGIPCNGPVWTDLLTKRKKDPLVEASYYLHEVCHLRSAAENLRKLAHMVGAGLPELAHVFERAGFSISGAQDLLRSEERLA